MRAGVLALAAAALLAGPGCFVRPWAIEESDRIERLMEYEVDDAEDEAFEGISAPRGLSPMAQASEQAFRSAKPDEPPKRKKSASRGSKKRVPFSSLTLDAGKSSKRR